ncbi:penicillin acylase family protein [Brevibacillus borstelensis]|jgi:penicillin G amidase|uniref:Penicillin acylase family protein n=1 Tax=Brevibacillus thermoruber TaxID=33942 RepID=A0A9X3TT24_9BACL|nr:MULTISPECIES: penicillin acylase family protein [Brevibacillus]MDA5110587.1 penicillin acylase family protein [Brevibacillus thermoruber]MED1746625.1 penicillin acylase family protein [Brevibacillus borstelensis]MED1885718.1 penicillin acylase family protein [Brevibacillus borstelensis]RNB57032.1 penicillin acylase family protein [Brevibacillus borstelensis]GED55550.1 beta-lactam antibiotic acylase [Brevibacillus borstelensis]
MFTGTQLHTPQAVKKRGWVRFRRFLSIVTITMVSMVILVSGALYIYTGLSLPTTEGELKLVGLKYPVSVYRDERGIPHIEARTERDLYMAQGYVTAQDRLFQMEMFRRIAGGRLAEITTMGDSLDSDKFFRTLQLRRSAEQSLKLLTPETKESLEAYSAGVNAYIKEAKAGFGKLPIEFSMMGFEPEEWNPTDTLLIGKYLAYMMGVNYRGESYRQHLINIVGEDMAKELFPTYPKDGYITIRKNLSKSPDKAVIQNDGKTASLGTFEFGPLLEDPFISAWADRYIGSNGWVVSGKLTLSGKPILSNDPHLFVQTPSIWYETHLILVGDEKRNVIGVTIPGILGIILGHNDKIAWGVTNAQADAQDLFVEKRNPINPRQFEYEGKWMDAEVINETISVKGQKAIEFEILNTVHGPIMNEFIGEGEYRTKKDISLQWTALRPSTDIEAFLAINKSTNYEQFKQALSMLQAPVLNFIFAGDDGTIAYHTAGLIPIRRQGDGVLPTEGWTRKHDWVGFIPFDQLPEAVNPEEGYIVTANNKIVDDSYPHIITKSWAAPYRAQRIAEVIESKKGRLTANDMIQLQTDVLNLQAKQLLPILIPLVEKADLNDIEGKALELLKSWDYKESPDQAAPLVYHFWMDQWNRLVFEYKMTPFVYTRMADKGNVIPEMILKAADGQENSWIKAAGGLKQSSLTSFRKAVEKVIELRGKAPTNWKWGEFHRFGPGHMTFEFVPVLNWFFNPEKYSVGGSETTVWMNAYNEESGNVIYSAPWRQVVDFSDLAGNSKDVLAAGQSEHVRSKWYKNQLKAQATGALYPQHFMPRDYQNSEKLVLLP